MQWLDIIKNAFTFYIVAEAPWAFQDLGLNLLIIRSLNQWILKYLTCSQAMTSKDAGTRFWDVKKSKVTLSTEDYSQILIQGALILLSQ